MASVSGILLLLLVADEDALRPEYDRILDHFKAARHEETIALGTEFLAAHPGYRFAHSVLYMTAEAQFRLRRFDECAAACERYAKEFPGGRYAPALAYRRCEALFKARRGKEAAQALEALCRTDPESTFAGRARALRARIDPRISRAEGPLVLDYAGKYRNDPRLAERVNEVRRLLPAALGNIRARLAPWDLPDPRFLVRFEDSGARRDGLHMTSNDEIHGKEVVDALTIRTEPLLLGLYDLEKTLTHEIFHCWQRDALGEPYFLLPKWVREGLALWVAKQGDDRLALLFASEGSNPDVDPLNRLANGLEGPHALADYGEDYLAIEWIEMSRGVDAVKGFVRSLFRPGDHRAAFAAAAGVPYGSFLGDARRWARERIAKGLRGRDEFLVARRLFLSKRFGEARRAYEALPPGPLRPRVLRDLSVCALETGDFAAAEAFLDECERFFPHSTFRDDCAWQRVEVARRRGDAEKARKLEEAYARDFSFAPRESPKAEEPEEEE